MPTPSFLGGIYSVGTSVEWVSDGPKPAMVIRAILLIPYPPSLEKYYPRTNSDLELPSSKVMILKEPPRNPRFFHENQQFFVFLT
jgi:hypothetical protein